MSVAATICPRCKMTTTGSNRLVIDSCGHSKCRTCFLADEQSCLECKQIEQEKQSIGKQEILDNKEKSKSKKKRSIITLPEHLKKVDKVYYCTVCVKSFHSRSQKYYHISCNNVQAKKHKCNSCEKSFATRSHLNYHLESHNSHTYSCQQCSKKFKNQAVLRKHEKVHQSMSVSCAQCELVFRCKDSLRAHVQQQHKNESFACNECDKKYAIKSRLKQHMLKHIANKHECNICGKRFQRNTTLKLHLKRHTKTECYVCTICCKNFSDAGALMRHAKTHADTIKYKCTHCDITTVRKDNMLRHVRNMHVGEHFNNCIEIIKPNETTTSACDETVSATDSSNTDTQIHLPKTIENSSVIKCIGNVQPMKIPQALAESAVENVEATTTFTTLETIKPPLIANATTVPHKKLKKKYDPIEMYRKILILDDEEDVNEEDGSLSSPTEANVKLLEDTATAQQNKPIESQRNTANTSNFSEMHWRKNFKYTYEYQDY